MASDSSENISAASKNFEHYGRNEANNPPSFLLLLSLMLIFLIPVSGLFTDSFFTLIGATDAEPLNLSASSFLDGSSQTTTESYLSTNFPGRNLMVRFFNQLGYTVFSTSENSNIAIGKNKTLYEKEYLNDGFDVWMNSSDADVKTLVSKLDTLERLINNDGIQLYVFITPSKVRFTKEDAPFYYKWAGEKEKSNYDTFITALNQSDINYFDSIAYINSEKENFNYPVFYPTGIHWSTAWATHVAAELNRYLRKKSGYDLGQINFAYSSSEEPIFQDNDLYQTMNLLKKPNIEFNSYDRVYTDGSAHPSIFCRGGSFMGYSIDQMLQSGVFSEYYYYQNEFIYSDPSDIHFTSAFNAYDEIPDLINDVKKSGILLLEVNEEKIGTMSWGFIDYLLENY